MSKGYKQTEEHKRKRVEAQKKWRASLSEEAKEKLRSARLGKHHSEEAKRKVSEANKGRICSEEHRKKISESLKGNPNLGWAKGIHLSEERKKRLSELGKGENNPFYGKKHSEETKKRISERAKGRIYPKERREKVSIRTKGENNPNWKGGITPLILKIRNSPKYIQWRTDIFTRDNFTCQKCGDNKGGNLQAHHIKRLKDIKETSNIKTIERALICEELWDTTNGITLCEGCHKLMHKKKVA
jgi:5-methylcytosine-specific restriction endonuclease McrA